MDSLFQIVNEELLCLKNNHNDPVIMIIMDREVPLQDRLLCSKCFRSKRQITKNIISIDEALNLIKEKDRNWNNQLEERKQQTLNDLNQFKEKMINLRSKILQIIDEILRVSQLWIQDIINIGTNNDVSKLIKDLELIDQNKNDIQDQLDGNNQSYYNKIDLIMQRIISIDDYSICRNLLKNTLNQQKGKLIHKVMPVQILDNQQQLNTQNQGYNIQLINTLKQDEGAFAIAFNYTGSIMVAGCGKDVQVWEFEQGQMVQRRKLYGHTDNIYCLVFSKKQNWFVSGSFDNKIRCWKQQVDKDWICSQPVKCHEHAVYCLILNKKEDQIISCSGDNSIKVWKVKYKDNQLEFLYKLENKHIDFVYCISLNESETSLVSCGEDKRIILWSKSWFSKKWEYKHDILMNDIGYRISFLNDNEIIWQQCNKGITHLFEIINEQLTMRHSKNIILNQEQDDDNLFPTIFNKNRKIIIQKHNHHVYILQQQVNGKLQVVSNPIDFSDKYHYGALTNDGQYLTISNYKKKELKVFRIKYSIELSNVQFCINIIKEIFELIFVNQLQLINKYIFIIQLFYINQQMVILNSIKINIISGACATIKYCDSCTATSCNTCQNCCTKIGNYCCQQSCQICDSQSKCSKCDSTTTLIAGICCPKECSGCDTPVVCTSCIDGYYLTEYATCKSCTSPCAKCKTTATTCLSCVSGKVLSGTACITCTKPCNLCSGSLTNCTSCVDPTYQSPPSCACPSNTYMDSSMKCVLCLSPCLTCNSSSSICSSCNNGYYLSGSFCLNCIKPCQTCLSSSTNCTTCIDPTNQSPSTCKCNSLSQFMLTSSYTCVNCYYPCQTCSSATICLSCVSNYLLSGTTCIPCIKPCQNCSGSTTYCSTCIDIHQTSPSCNCISGYLMNSSTKLCNQCTFPCQTCQTTLTYCLTCASTYTFNSNTCNCLNTQFEKSGSPKTCQACTSPCLTCSTSSTNCNSCITGLNRHLSSNKCICDDYLYDDGVICKPCILPCIKCSSLTVCISCNDSLQLLSSCNCQNLYYTDSLYTCQSCSSPCKYCKNSDINCTQCYPTYYLFTTTTPNTCLSCVSPCVNCTSISACTSCVSNYLLSGTTCIPCTKPCANCIGSITTCTSCIDIHQTTPLCSCNSGYLIDSTSKLCVACIFPCATCQTSLTYCLTCAPTYSLNSTTHTCACLNTQFEIFTTNPYTCQGCTNPCQTCNTLATRCTSCVSGSNRHLKTATDKCVCNDGFYDDGICKPCISPCLYCQDATATCTCQEGYYMDGSSICQSCLAPCFDCHSNATTCDSCIDTYYFDGSNCNLCTLPCKNCIDSSSKCKSCAQVIQKLQNDTCVCPDGYFMDGSFNCSLCTHPCKNCIDNDIKCLTCAATFSLSFIPNTCGCLDGFFEELAHNPTDCNVCSLPCKTCIISTNHCVTCNDSNQIVNSNYQCICKQGYIANGLICDQCLNPCIDCIGTITYCTGCKDIHHQLNSGQCKCEDGWLNDSNYDCQSCVAPCKTCSTTTIHCDTCTDINHLLNGSNQCYCKDKFYSDTPATCSPCVLPCDKCDIKGCLTCIDPNQRIDTNLNCVCQDNYYVDGNSNYNCSPCQLPCVTCLTQLQCQTCIDLHQTLINHQCICNSRYYMLGTGCDLCQLPCIDCLNTPYTCLSCSDPNHILINNKCVCKDGWVASDNTGIRCYECEYPCEKCINNVHTCLSCIDTGQYQLVDNQCICQLNFYQVGIQCHQCSLQCRECQNQSNYCLSCSDLNHIFMQNDCFCKLGYYYDQQFKCQNCLSPCQTCIMNYVYCTSCISDLYDLKGNKCHCINGYYYDQIDCSHCQSICTKCLDYDICTECIDGYYLQDYQCLKCHSICNTCITNSKQCLSCSDAYFMDNDGKCSQCINNCKLCSDSFTCELCYDGSYLEDKICLECSLNCLTCVDRVDHCLTCKQNFEITEQYMCHCIKGYQQSNNFCIKCPYPCLECQSVNFCEKCDQLPNLILSNQNQCTCIDGYYLQNQNCQLCDQTCQTCSNSNNNCLSCNYLQYRTLWQNRCYCKGNYYEDSNNQCVSCLQETAKIVKSCMYKDPNDYIWTYGEECDDGNPISRDGCSNFIIDKGYQCINVILEASICYQCPSNCYNCKLNDKESQCTNCNIGYFLKENKCLICQLKCLTCAETPSNCTACRFLRDSVTKECQLCEQLQGYYSNYINNQCYSVCGDAIKANNEECDDNLVDGDGCDQYCKKQSQFICKDNICTQPEYPIPQLRSFNDTSLYNNKRQFILDYNVKLNCNECQIISEQFQFYILNDKTEQILIDYPFTIKQNIIIDHNFTNYSAFIDIQLNKTYQFNIKILIQQYLNKVTSQIQEFQFVDIQTLERVRLVTSLNINILLILAILAGIAMLFGGIEIYYNLLDTLQMLSYLKYINTQMPYNLEEFFNLFQFAQFTFIQNFFDIQSLLSFDNSKLKAIPEKIAADQYNSLFLINGASNLIVSFSLFGLYILAKTIPSLLNFFKPKDVSSIPGVTDLQMRVRLYYLAFKIFVIRICYNYISELFYSGILRTQISTSYDYSFSIVLQLFAIQFNSNSIVANISSFLSILALFGYLYTVLFVVKMSNMQKYIYKNTTIKQQLGTIFEGVNKRKHSKYFNAIILTKKLFFQLILIFCSSSPIFQSIVLTISSLLQSLVLIVFKPLENVLELKKQISCEIILFFVLQLLAILTIDNQLIYFQGITHQTIGWCCITLMSSLLGIQLYFDLLQQWQVLIKKYKIIKRIIDKIKSLFRGPEKQCTTPNLFDPI